MSAKTAVLSKKKTFDNDGLFLRLFEVLNDDADADPTWPPPTEFGDPGIMGKIFIETAQKAGVSLVYTVRAALYCFWADHQDVFIADPQNLKYRNPTPEEDRILMGPLGLRGAEEAELEKALRRAGLQVSPGRAS